MALAVVALGIGVLVIANGGLGKFAEAVGTTFGGLVTNLTKTPQPSAPDVVAANPPTLEAPAEPYTNQPTVDLVGTVPAAIVGQAGMQIRIYVAIGKGDPAVAREMALPAGRQFQVPAMTLSVGPNTFTATIVGPNDIESDASASVTYVFDKTKPKITISSPAPNGIVNAKSVQIVGTTQGRSSIRLHNATANATVVGAADAKGAFSVAIAIAAGENKIQVTATDPAGNATTTSLTVRRGTGALTARLTASFYQLRLSRLPESVQLAVLVNNPDGRPLEGASVTFTLAIPNVPAIASSTILTTSTGRASFTTTIPKGATAGQCSVTVSVHTTDFGDTTDRAVIVLQK